MTLIVLIALNALVSLASVGWAIVALVRPAVLSGSHIVDGGEIFYTRLYAARSVPFGLATAMLPIWLSGLAIAWVLFTAAAIQAADVAVAVAKAERRMIVGASIGTAVHLLCGVAIR